MIASSRSTILWTAATTSRRSSGSPAKARSAWSTSASRITFIAPDTMDVDTVTGFEINGEIE